MIRCTDCQDPIPLKYGQLEGVICCGLHLCDKCFAKHDVKKHEYPEVLDED